MRKIYLLLFVFLPYLLSAQLVAKSTKSSTGQFIGFYQYTPSGWSTSTEKYPVIIFLHGVGERGNGTSELYRVTNVAIPKYLKNGSKPFRYYVNGKWQSFVVMAPQLSTAYGSWQNFYIDAMIDYAVKYLKGDPNRIILTGLSLGGGGVWKYATSSSANAAKLAALVPVCGTCAMSNASYIASNNLAVWGFHSVNDPRVSPACTKDAIAKINALNPKIPAIFTGYTVASHSIWDFAYDDIYKYQNPHVFEWMLGQNKSMGANKAPTVAAPTSVSVTTGTAKAVLNGSATDIDGTIWKYVWRKVSGPSGSKMVDSTSKTLSLTGLTTAGTYVYRLIGVDNNVYWNLKDVKVLVTAGAATGNSDPVANAGADKTVDLPTSSATLSGSGSSDADGSITSYAWSKLSGPSGGTLSSPTAVTTTVSGLVAGTYIYRLTVKDNVGATNTDDVTVTVSNTATSSAPVVSAGVDQIIALPDNTASLSASATDDGTIKSYAWSQVSGPSTAIIANTTYKSTAVSGLVAGTYRFRVKVTDDGGLSTTDDTYINVKIAPSANAGLDQALKVSYATLNGSNSKDADGTITRYLWTQLSGPNTATIASPEAVSTKVSGLITGTYLFRLKIFDNDGFTDTDGMYVTVNGGTATLAAALSATEATESISATEKIVSSPNPVRSYTNVTISNPATGLTYFNVYDLGGKLVKRVTANKASQVLTQQLDLSGLLPGTYQIQAQINNKANMLTRIVKQ